LRLVSPNDRGFRWVAGAYYIHEEKNLETRGFLDPDHNRNEYYNPTLIIIDRAEVDHNYAWALYGQADYDITSALTLTGALRYDSDHRDQLNLSTGLTRTADFDRPQPKATLTYHIDPQRLVYATYSTGFRSGGFNAPGVALESFKAETLNNYEAGFKSSWLDRRLTLNGDVYYATDHNYQFFYVDAVTVSQVIGNIDSVHIWGTELEAQWALASGLDVFGGLGTTNTRIVSSTEFTGVDDNHTPKTVPWKLNLGMQYQWPLTNDLDGFLRIDYEHRDKEYWQIDNVNVQKPIDLVNARLGVKKGRFGLYLWGKNLTNTQYFEDYNPAKFTGEAYDLGWRAEPRTYGVELRATF
jgi:iron complex outermembrane receptor protein